MKRIYLFTILIISCSAVFSQQTTTNVLPFKMEELTSPKFATAVEKAGGVCIIPLGIIEKHGPHLPLGTDMFEAREVAFTAAKKEYAVVFPPYFVGQIFEARHQPGTIAYSNELMWKMLEETCGELSRNGLKKIVLVNGHGGNSGFLQYFCQSQLAERKGYIVVLFQPGTDPELGKEIKALKKAKIDGHAGEEETSMMYFIRPDLVDTDAIKNESGLNQARLKQMKYGYTGIWWYANYPNHYASDVAEPNKRLGELLIEQDAVQLAELVRFLKTDNTVEKLQDEFFKRAANPLMK
ncbi:MAG TPA: creatininase family protein [Bacteroidales bacterium]|nr:creatininase [Bacteroidales bacterium]HOU95966.1 creatininase family protein [Bacteroidales bacterium]HQG36521.1 creatininase family protein [Bacteroidales bacterium]HQG53011.1 creatininase family protein [Bacteroidales bacterium]HQJ20633.1 creatininase family protein [Bacteroidales bacterium]